MSPRETAGGDGRPPMEANCGSCWIRRHCLLGQLSEKADGVADAVTYSGLLPRRARLYRQDAPADTLFVVRSGSAKTSMLTEGGAEHVLDLHLPGDLLGLEDVYTGRYVAAAATLERSSVCSVKSSAVDRLVQGDGDKMHALLQAFGRHMQQQREARLLIRHVGAGRRLERFLLDWSARLESLGFSGIRLMFNMTRFDLGSFLALAPETVSRKLTYLQQLGIVELDGREMKIDKEALLEEYHAVDAA